MPNPSTLAEMEEAQGVVAESYYLPSRTVGLEHQITELQRQLAQTEVSAAETSKRYQELYLKHAQVTSELGLQVSDLKGTVGILAKDRDEAMARADRMLIENNALVEQVRALKRVAEVAQRFRRLTHGLELQYLGEDVLHGLADADADLEAKLEDAGFKE